MVTTAGLRLAAAVAGAVMAAGCASGHRATAPTPMPAQTAEIRTSTSAPDPTSAMRQWVEVAGEHFTRSARALQQVSEGSDAGDEAAVQAGCQVLHDTNAVDLQRDLPTPDPALTAELQRMIDDMNVATHACLRFALGRNPADATVYQDYLAKAVDHLLRAKVILDEDLRPR